MGNRPKLLEGRPTIFETSDFPGAIRSWLESTGELGLPVGRAPAEALPRAIRLIRRLRKAKPEVVLPELQADPGTPDVLYAMIDVLDHYREAPSRPNLDDLVRVYEFALKLMWDDEFAERSEMLARLSFLAWNQCRMLEDYPATRVWQARCSEHTLAQEHARYFMSLRSAERSTELRDRFLRDEAIFLTVCDRLARERNRVPAECLTEAEALYDWLEQFALRDRSCSELVHFLAATVALNVVGGRNHIYVEFHDQWGSRVRWHISKSRGSAPLAALLEHQRLSGLYHRYKCTTELAKSCMHLVGQLEALGMSDAACRTRYLLGVVWQDLGEHDRAVSVLSRAHSDATEVGDPIVASLALAAIAQILGKDNLIEAVTTARKALTLAEAAGCDWAVAHVQASIGELLRDSGSLSASIDAYASAVQLLEKAGHRAQAAYLHVVLAEALLMADRPSEAATEILAALPIVEQHHLTREAVAAVALLREAFKRQEADPESLRQLREQLQLMRREGKL